MTVDILVIGDGLSGHIACAHARQAGAKVALVSRSMGMTALGSGALDVAYTRALAPDVCPTAGLLDHLEDVVRHEAGHLFAKLGTSESLRTVTAGHQCLVALLRSSQLTPGALNWGAAPGLYPAAFGGLYPAAAQIDRAVSPPVRGHWGVVGLAGDVSMSAPSVARGFNFDAETYGQALTFESVVVETDLAQGATSPLFWAEQLDDPERAQKFCASVAKAVARRGFSGLVMPPVLGIERHQILCEALEAACAIPVVEALAQLPSVRGVRLMRSLRRAQPREASYAQAVVGLEWQGDALERAVLADGSTLRAKAVVLATGRAVGGGLVAPQDGLPHETLCKLALLDADGSPMSTGFESASSPSLSAPQRLLEIRLATDTTLRPRAWPNRPLFVAGDLLVGHPQAAARIATSDGTALASGILAAEGALAACGHQKGSGE